MLINYLILRKYDWLLAMNVFVLSLVGFAAIYSVDLSRGDKLTFFPTQAVAFAIGIILLLVALGVESAVYRNGARRLYWLSVILLVGVLFFGATVRGTTGWYRVVGISFQPAELAKIGLILMLAWLISRYGRRFDSVQFVIASGLIALLPIGLILWQPDLGSALVIFGIWFGLMIMTGIKKRYLALLFIILLAAIVVGWFFLFKPYQRERILTFVDPARDPLGTGYNVAQSIIAVGSGRFLGRGLGFGSQSQLHFLPEAQTDFVFSVIAEELGFAGVFIVLSLFFLLFWRLLRIVVNTRDEFGAYAVLGIILMFVVQLMLNIGGSLGILPVTGVTLPFVSYGGSSMVMNFFIVGIAISVGHSTLASADVSRQDVSRDSSS